MPTTAEPSGSLTGRRAIVTGGNSGLGWQTAAALARRGAEVTLACRDVEAASRAADRIRASYPHSRVAVMPLDLASLASVRGFASSWQGSLHLLVNNAGVMAPPKWRDTADGFELQFGVNHLGHFALTGLLLPSLLAAVEPRVVTVSSLSHRAASAAVLLGNPPDGYRPMLGYANSKLANLLFGLELHRRAGGSVASTMAHPGVSNTNLGLSPDGAGRNPAFRWAAKVLSPLVLQSARAGARPILYAAGSAMSGSYTGPAFLGEWRGPPTSARLSGPAQDPGLAAQLWELSEELTEVEFSFR